jgi:hypothetical protein
MQPEDEEEDESPKPLEDSPLPENAFRVPAALRRTALWIMGAALILSLGLLIWRALDPSPDTDPTRMELVYLLVTFATSKGGVCPC